MKIRYVVYLALILVLLVSGCNKGISKKEAENVAYNFMKDLNFRTINIHDSYREGTYWKVTVSADEGAAVLLEINANTGKLEWIVEDGERYSLEELQRQVVLASLG